MPGRTTCLGWMLIASLGLFGAAELSASEDLPDVHCTRGEDVGSIINSRSCAVVFQFAGADRIFFHLSRRTLSYLGKSVPRNSKAAVELRNIAESFRNFSRSEKFKRTPERSLAFIYTKPISTNRRQVCAIFFLESWDASLAEARQHRLGSDCYDIIVRLAWAAAATVSAEDEQRTSMFINNVYSNRRLAAKLTREDSILASMGRMAGRLKPTTQGSLVVVLGVAASALAEPTKVTEIKGKRLFLYETEGGKRVDSMNPKDVPLPLDILGVSDHGKFLVEIPGIGEFWILMAQTVTDEGLPEVLVDCQSIATSYVIARRFGDCN